VLEDRRWPVSWVSHIRRFQDLAFRDRPTCRKPQSFSPASSAFRPSLCRLQSQWRQLRFVLGGFREVVQFTEAGLKEFIGSRLSSAALRRHCGSFAMNALTKTSSMSCCLNFRSSCTSSASPATCWPRVLRWTGSRLFPNSRQSARLSPLAGCLDGSEVNGVRREERYRSWLSRKGMGSQFSRHGSAADQVRRGEAPAGERQAVQQALGSVSRDLRLRTPS